MVQTQPLHNIWKPAESREEASSSYAGMLMASAPVGLALTGKGSVLAVAEAICRPTPYNSSGRVTGPLFKAPFFRIARDALTSLSGARAISAPDVFSMLDSST